MNVLLRIFTDLLREHVANVSGDSDVRPTGHCFVFGVLFLEERRIDFSTNFHRCALRSHALNKNPSKWVKNCDVAEMNGSVQKVGS